MGTKKPIASVKNVPLGGSLIVKTNEGDEVALFNVNGMIYGLDNACPHQGSALGEGAIQDTTVTCPGHAWNFNIITGECLDYPGEDATTIPLEIIDGEIFLSQ